MPKTIVILFDGTSNEVSSSRSNILRLFRTLKRDKEQIVFYDPGVGTIGPENAILPSKRKAAEFWGLATGWGLEENVKQAYRFLVENYNNKVVEANKEDDEGAEPSEEAGGRDTIFIFGFSRGAYTARVLSGFIHAIGLMEPIHLNLLDYAFRDFKRISDKAAARGDGRLTKDDFVDFRPYQQVLRNDYPPIRCLGLFDTVASVLEPDGLIPKLRHFPFDDQKNRSVESVRHALAIDERRCMYRPLLWGEAGKYWGNPFNRKAEKDQDVKEVWFRGAHSDVGGAYAEEKSGLAKIALHWMIEETKAMGLRYKTQTINQIVLGKRDDGHSKSDHLGDIHDSMKGKWKWMEYLPQFRPGSQSRLSDLHLPLSSARPIEEGACIHQSVVDRFNEPGRVKPPNLPGSYEVEDGPQT